MWQDVVVAQVVVAVAVAVVVGVLEHADVKRNVDYSFSLILRVDLKETSLFDYLVPE